MSTSEYILNEHTSNQGKIASRKQEDSPACSVRRSARARSIHLRVLPGKGLEVVLPYWADMSVVPQVLERHQRWIKKHMDRLSDESRAMPEVLPAMLLLRGGTEEVHIISGNRDRSVGQAASCGGGVFGANSAGEICNKNAPASCFCFGMEENGTAPSLTSESVVFTGIPKPVPVRRTLRLPPGDLESGLFRLREWVREEARRYLGARLESLAREHGLAYAKLSVRFQKSRWGSCSARGGISLNAGLLFLPDRLINYILLHELCHTRHMNHSQSFWKLLFSLDPDALDRDREMRRAWKYIPLWLYRM